MDRFGDDDGGRCGVEWVLRGLGSCYTGHERVEIGEEGLEGAEDDATSILHGVHLTSS